MSSATTPLDAHGSSAPPRLDDYTAPADMTELVARARYEDLGPDGLDITSAALIPAEQQGRAVMRARQAGVLAGAALLPAIVAAYDSAVKLESLRVDAAKLQPGAEVARFTGPLRSILAIERIALNFVTHLSGIATLTARHVELVRGTRARICDTRKTIPGLRGMAKYAVACGGGVSHRMGLYDAVLIKDNHIAHLALADLGAAVRQAVERIGRQNLAVKFIEVEVDSLNQLEQVLSAGMDFVLLDNLPPEVLRQAVVMRDRVAPGVLLEASGGVNLDTVAAIAQTGVDRISVGALTHSAPSLDLGLDIA
ncbi:MAG: carboxylating nicotinate-nucleotide diphosphorylase [Phycisphaeraceae bacterium]